MTTHTEAAPGEVQKSNHQAEQNHEIEGIIATIKRITKSVWLKIKTFFKNIFTSPGDTTTALPPMTAVSSTTQADVTTASQATPAATAVPATAEAPAAPAAPATAAAPAAPATAEAPAVPATAD